MDGELKIKKAQQIVEKHFSYGELSFDYQLVRQRRKTLSLTVNPTQSVVLKAPSVATRSDIDDFLRRKSRWVMKKKMYFAGLEIQPEKQYVSGESVLYCGKSYRLQIVGNATCEHVQLQDETVVIHTDHPEDPEHNRDLLDKWYMQRAQEVCARRLKICFARFDHTEIPRIIIKKMKRQWGSYSRKTHRVALNLKLIQASTDHIDYVIIHELCHIDHMRHDAAFYNHLSSILPQWKTLKTELEQQLL